MSSPINRKSTPKKGLAALAGGIKRLPINWQTARSLLKSKPYGYVSELESKIAAEMADYNRLKRGEQPKLQERTIETVQCSDCDEEIPRSYDAIRAHFELHGGKKSASKSALNLLRKTFGH